MQGLWHYSIVKLHLMSSTQLLLLIVNDRTFQPKCLCKLLKQFTKTFGCNVLPLSIYQQLFSPYQEKICCQYLHKYEHLQHHDTTCCNGNCEKRKHAVIVKWAWMTKGIQNGLLVRQSRSYDCHNTMSETCFTAIGVSLQLLLNHSKACKRLAVTAS